MKKRVYLILMCLCIALAIAVICVTIINRSTREEKQHDVEGLRDQLKVYQTDAETDAPVVETDAPETEETELPETTLPEETEPDESETVLPETEPPIILDATLDFESMWKVNPDICAWIEIDGTMVDYPVLQNENDSKYLTTAVDGTYYAGGSLFTQSAYNSRDFNDPVTIIYGHTMRSGTLFGQLQPVYTSPTGFAEHSEIKLYLPDEVRYYSVFAAVPYSNMHILDAYDFSVEYWYENFFNGVFKIRELGVQFNRDITPEPGDRIIILSTCLNEDRSKRFLVMAIHQDDID